MVSNLDDTDRGILHGLQEDARNVTAAEMAEMVGVSPSTVRNRIEQLEDEGVVRGYLPEIDYEQAGFDLHMFLVGRVPTADRHDVAEAALELPGVVNVRELITGEHNIHLEVVAVDSEGADETVAGIEGLGVEIVSTQIIKELQVQPFNHFGMDVLEE